MFKMENNTWSEQAVSQRRAAFCSRESERNGETSLHGEDGNSTTAKEEVKETVRSLVERFGLSREDLVSAYDECMLDRDGREVRLEKNDSASLQQQQHEPVQPSANCTATPATCSAVVRLNGVSEGAMELQEEGEEQEQSGEDEEEDEMGEDSQRETGEWGRENGGRLESLSDSSPLEEKEEVDKMQTLVQSALRVYEASSLIPELGQKRRSFTLEDELNMQPSSFAQELLDRDQTVVAQAIKKYMNQYSVPQREVVEKTGLNQSHLSQHFLHGVTMKRSKRVKLYHWFEDDQKIRTGKPSTADSALNSVLESPKVEGSRRRPRWKWSPISTQILSEAFKKNHFPTREQRVELARVCNDAELTMNNGSPIRGPEGDTEGITEQRINTWFTNRRKGLSTPSPTRGGLAMTPSNTLFAHSLPPLLRAATPTTPTHSYSHTLELEHRNEDKTFVPATPTAVQTFVSHLQHVQAATSSGAAVQLAGTHTATAQALPLTTFTLPGGASGAVLAPGTSLAAISQPPSTLAASPLQTITINPEGIPATLIPPSQLQAILSQVHVSSDSGLPAHIQLANSSGGFITIPMMHPQKVTAAAITPSPFHTYTVTSSPATVKSNAREIIIPSAVRSSTSSNSPSPSPCTYPSPTLTALPTFTQSQAPAQASLPTIIGSNQVHALLSQLQAQAKLQGMPHVQYNPTSSLPLTITLPGASSEDILRAQALLVNHQGTSD